jgi:phosphoglycerate dehydrogenase-like enzyme
MAEKPRILLLNGTCLDVVDEHRQWLAGLPVDVIADPAFRRLTAGQLTSLLLDVDGVVMPAAVRISPEQMAHAGRLRVISLASSGFDSVDLEAATRCGIVVTHAPVTELSEVVADLAWGLILAVSRQIVLHDRQIRMGNRERGMGTSPWRKTLGIVGLGSIGRAVVRRASGFEMRVLAAEPRPDMEFVEGHHVQLVEIDALLAQSDFVSLHARLSDATRGLIGVRQLELMQPSAFLINTARQDLVDEAALTSALLSGRIAGAALDDPPVDSHGPLLQLPNVIFTTHIGNRAWDGVHAVFRQAIENAVDVLLERRPPWVVNPEVYGRSVPAARTVTTM